MKKKITELNKDEKNAIALELAIQTLKEMARVIGNAAVDLGKRFPQAAPAKTKNYTTGQDPMYMHDAARSLNVSPKEFVNWLEAIGWIVKRGIRKRSYPRKGKVKAGLLGTTDGGGITITIKGYRKLEALLKEGE